MAFLLPALIALVPLILMPGLLFHYDVVPKIALLALAMAIILLRPSETVQAIAHLRTRLAGRLLLYLASAQIVWFGTASALSSRPWFSLLGANWRRMGFATDLVLAVFAVLASGALVRKLRLLTHALRAFAIASILASLYGIAQYFDVDPLQPSAAYQAHAGDSVIIRPPGTLGHADYFAWWLAIAVFAAVSLERVETNPAWRWTARVAYILSALAILFSGTRSAILAVAAGLAYLAFASHARPTVRTYAAAAALAAALIVFYLSPAGLRLRARVQWSATEPLGGARPLLWRDSLRMAAARPIAGFGPETFSAEFPRYQSTALANLLPDFYYESPHNSALDALIDQGAPGLLLALAWIALALYAAHHAPAEIRPVAASLAAAVVASATAGIFGVMTFGPVFATAAAIAMLVALTPTDWPANPPSSTAVLAASAPIALCLAAYAVALLVSDHALAVFQHASPAQRVEAWRAAASRAMPGAADDLTGSRTLMSFCPTLPGMVESTACWSVTADAAKHAPATADNPSNAWYNLAIFAAIHNDSTLLESSLRKSAALAPNWFKPHWSLANYLLLTGRIPEAHDEATRAVELDAGRDAEVTDTLTKLKRQIQ